MSEVMRDLTPERQGIIDAAYQDYLAVGLSTQPADFDAAEAAIESLYKSIGKPKPYFVRLSSPLGAELYINLYCSAFGNRGQLRDQLGGQLWDQLGGQLRGQLMGQLWDQLGGQLRFTGTWFHGSWDYYWMYLEAARGLGVIYEASANAQLSDHITVARSIGWWYPFDEFCIITDRPECIHRDDQSRLHHETAQALKYRDGTGLFAWHGTRVPNHWVPNKDSLDPNEVIKCENVEQRAAGLQIVGLPRMKSHPSMQYRVLDGDPETRLGALVEMKLEGLPEPGRFLEAVCPRNGTIIEGVPHISDIDNLPIETVTAAQAWRLGDRAEDFQLSPRRT